MNFTRTLHVTALLGLFLAPAGAVAGLSFGVGPLGGMNFGNAAIDGHDKTDYRYGVAGGISAELGVTSPFSLLIEPMYVQKGADFEYLGGIQASGELDYIEVPVLLKAKFGAQRAHAYAFVGPSVDFNTRAKGSISTYSDDFEKQASNVVLAGDVGAGAAFQVQQYVYLWADVRYCYGFTNALQDNVGDIDSWKSRDIRLLAGVLFHLTE